MDTRLKLRRDLIPLQDHEIEPLNWNQNFRYPGMIRKRTIGDGSCFFHAITDSYFDPYRLGYFKGKPITKSQIVKSLREELAVKLGEPVDRLNPDGPRNYDILSNGTLAEFSKEWPQYSLSHMQKELASSHAAIDNVYNEFISNQLGKDIYLLDAENHDVRFTGDDYSLLHKQRPSIVILCLPGHYELVGIQNPNDLSIQTYFATDHPFIQAIRQRIAQIQSGISPMVVETTIGSQMDAVARRENWGLKLNQ